MSAKAAEKKVLIQAWIPPALKDKMERAAAEEGISLANYVRRTFTKKLGA